MYCLFILKLIILNLFNHASLIFFNVFDKRLLWFVNAKVINAVKSISTDDPLEPWGPSAVWAFCSFQVLNAFSIKTVQSTGTIWWCASGIVVDSVYFDWRCLFWFHFWGSFLETRFKRHREQKNKAEKEYSCFRWHFY